jgi:hypothetical protein
VLHDMFDIPYGQIAPIIERSPVPARQLASRARRRVRAAGAAPVTDPGRQREVVAAFLAASRGGDFGALLTMLDPGVALRADPAAVQMGASKEVRGAAAVADAFAGRLRGAQPAPINGAPGAAWAPGGHPRVIFAFTITCGTITAIELAADPERLRHLDLTILEVTSPR